MKKRFFVTLLSLVCFAAAFVFAACGDDNGSEGSGKEPPQVELKESAAPVDMRVYCTTTTIQVDRAVYDESGTPSSYSEYKLDEGEWSAAQEGNYEAVFRDLTPGSSHTVYARQGAHGKYKASAAYSVSVTLEKEYRYDRPETAVYDVTGKTLTVTLDEGMEVSFDERATYTTDGTHTYDETGETTFYLRYRETATHHASDYRRFSVVITDFAGGTGTEENPYRINTFEQFKLLQTATYLHSGDWVKLTADITFDDEAWSGTQSGLKLNIDGGGHKIISPKLINPLFYNLDTVKNLTVEQAEYVIDLAGNETTAAVLTDWVQWAENVSVSGTIAISCGEKLSYFRKYPVSVGGIAVFLSQPYGGGAYGMRNCSVDLSVTLPDTTEWGSNYSLALGGLAATVTRSSGSNDVAEISACAVNLSVTGGVIDYGDVGGLVGGLVASSESGSSDREAPPIAVSDSYATGSVALKIVWKVISGFSKGVTRIGGIAPAVRGSIEHCYSSIAFDITADVYHNSNEDYQPEILIGGIVAEGAHDGMTAPKLSNVFFAGSITVKNIAEETRKGGRFNNGVVCVQPAEFASPSNLYYVQAALSVPEDAEQVTASELDTAVSENDLFSEIWQKSNLGWDEAIWALQDGKLPVLK